MLYNQIIIYLLRQQPIVNKPGLIDYKQCRLSLIYVKRTEMGIKIFYICVSLEASKLRELQI